MNAGRIFRRRGGQDVRAWPLLALLLLVVAVAIGCVLWFMREAMRNERLAVREKLAEAYRGQLALIQKHAEEQWMRELARFDDGEPGPALFARAVREGWADSVVCFDTAGHVVYPRIDGAGRLAEANAELLALESDPRNSGLFKLPGLEKKIRVAVDWTLDLFFPKNLMQRITFRGVEALSAQVHALRDDLTPRADETPPSEQNGPSSHSDDARVELQTSEVRR